MAQIRGNFIQEWVSYTLFFNPTFFYAVEGRGTDFVWITNRSTIF